MKVMDGKGGELTQKRWCQVPEMVSHREVWMRLIEKNRVDFRDKEQSVIRNEDHVGG